MTRSKRLELKQALLVTLLDALLMLATWFFFKLVEYLSHRMTLLLSRFTLHNHHHLHRNVFVLKYANT